MAVSVFSLSGCGGNPNAASISPPVITREKAAETAKEEKVKTTSPPVFYHEPPRDSSGNIQYPYFEISYILENDRASFPYDHVDITVGDRHYMTQINDWYMNFKDYHDKTVVIEGYFLSINGHFFIGRNGPTCPYCTGGYVDFEFNSDQDFTRYRPGVTWIRLYGILRDATGHTGPGISGPFYHLEAVKVEEIPYTGKGTISD